MLEDPTQSRRVPLPDLPGGWVERNVRIGTRPVSLLLPAEPDRLLDDPEVQARHVRDDYMPYWPYLWPASLTMARLVAARNWGPDGPVLELGCGVGLVGLAAGLCGTRVLFNDHDETAVQVAVANARRAGIANAHGAPFDWRDPPALSVPAVLACDVLYEDALHVPLLETLDRVLDQRGSCWIGDPGRRQAQAFSELARSHGYDVFVRDEHGAEAELGATQFRLLVLRKP